METGKVSVILPVYNMAGSLPETLDSVLRNAVELGDTEVIVVDDGSLDASFRVACVYGEKYPGVVRVYSQPNAGSGPARNLGMSKARGEYIAFMDADDFYPRDTVLRDLYRTAKEKNVLVCGGSIMVLSPDGTQVDKLPRSYRKFVFDEDGYVMYSDHQFPFGYQGFLYRRSFLEEQKILFPDYLRFQDPPFFVRAMLAAGKFYALKEPAYAYRWGIKNLRWSERKVLDLLQGFSDLMCLAKNAGYNELYCTAYKDYRHYVNSHVFLDEIARGTSSQVFLSWCRFVESLDKTILRSYGIPMEELSVRWVVSSMYPYNDIKKIVLRAKEEQLMEDTVEQRPGIVVEEQNESVDSALGTDGASPAAFLDSDTGETKRMGVKKTLLEAELAATRLEVEDLRARYNAVGGFSSGP